LAADQVAETGTVDHDYLGGLERDRVGRVGLDRRERDLGETLRRPEDADDLFASVRSEAENAHGAVLHDVETLRLLPFPEEHFALLQRQQRAPVRDVGEIVRRHGGKQPALPQGCTHGDLAGGHCLADHARHEVKVVAGLILIKAIAYRSRKLPP